MTWKFDKTIASVYLEHVRSHIPDYDKVIAITVDACDDLCSKQHLLVDLGCATGHTLEQLHHRGFKNLIGIDSSQDMIDRCDKTIATYSCTDKLPDAKYVAILANWVLHFNNNKKEILQDCYNNLLEGGILILSEKTLLDQYSIDKYYEWKFSQGVSWADIKAKEESLKGKMFLDSPEWYFTTLKDIGFTSVSLLNGSLGFMTLMAFKD